MTSVVSPTACARSVWTSGVRPTPDELRTAIYDAPAAQAPLAKLVVCAAPRCSSKRLARLLLSAGLGVPMEYFNNNSVKALTQRWGVRKRHYVQAIFSKRSANGVFATNLQYHQIEVWPYPLAFRELFDNATLIHLVRPDATAQAASLATSMLTGRWGFEDTTAHVAYTERQLRRAAHEAVRAIAAEERGWAQWFAANHLTPSRVTANQVNCNDLDLVKDISARINVLPDLDSAARMLEIDNGPYRGDAGLKAELRAIIEATAT